MKRLKIPILLCVCCILLCSCTNDRTQYYKQRISSYEEIALYASDKYATQDGSRACILLSDISDKVLSESIFIAQEKFTYIWIENNNVIFWNNEMKTLGLIYSEDISSAIKDIKAWYNGFEAQKINSRFCLIGQLSAV